MATTEWFEGGCHCGGVRWAAMLPSAADSPLIATTCNCSMCTKKGAFLHHHVEPADFKLLSDPSVLTEYRFGTRTARHLFCSLCGVHSHYFSRSHPDKVDINLRCCDAFPEHLQPRLQAVSFDGRHWEHNISGFKHVDR